MNSREWALVAFTLLAQLSVGAFLALGAVQCAAARVLGAGPAARVPAAPLGAVVALLGLGVIASLFHLGQPLTAFLALANLRSSWLSREILMTTMFGAGAAALWVAAVMGGRSWLLATLWIVTSVCGLGLVVSMAQVYRLAAQPSWNTLLTPVSFVLTTLVLGSAAAVVGAEWLSPGTTLASVDQARQLASTRIVIGAAALSCAALILLELVMVPMHALDAVGWAHAAGGRMPELSWVGLVAGATIRASLSAAGAGLMLWAGYRAITAAGMTPGAGLIGWGAFAGIVAAEVAGRWLFYGTRAGNALS